MYCIIYSTNKHFIVIVLTNVSVNLTLIAPGHVKINTLWKLRHIKNSFYHSVVTDEKFTKQFHFQTVHY